MVELEMEVKWEVAVQVELEKNVPDEAAESSSMMIILGTENKRKTCELRPFFQFYSVNKTSHFPPQKFTWYMSLEDYLNIYVNI